MSPTYAALCECGRSNTVEPHQMGGRHPCHCGLMLNLPSAAEFQENPAQKAYTSVLQKVNALLEAGLLPGLPDCQACGVPTDRRVEVPVECEQARAITTGRTDLLTAVVLVLTLMFSPVVILLRPRPSVTTIGRDTYVTVPVRLCEPCQRVLTSRRNPAAFAVMVGGAIVSAMVAVFAGWWAILPVVLAILLLVLIAPLAHRRRRRDCRTMFAVVPVYAELLQTYRLAEVHVPGQE